MKIAIRVLVVFLCLVGFAFIRFRESELFYDPLIPFFKSNYQKMTLPDMESWRLFFHIFLRYALNMFLSLVILWVAFRERGIIKFASLFYGVVFVVLIVIFSILLKTQGLGEYLPIFYVRRFLIQPILLFMLLPAFYYYRKVNNS
ncbi:exosortase F system-associated membrane protein [Dokdonia pacifica]|uniref:Exosortase F-associated protein n=1 Tax=Dokdonia pacifica TaxID=1627892 RepID=A0A239DIC4_9FLAO|nr:exosortase F system-associated protein [Dokdonia pacifica]SNS32117.1 exosortase F-associated protein [Dokdonia pacifica]